LKNEYYYFLTPLAGEIFYGEKLSKADKKSSQFQPIKVSRQEHCFLIAEIMLKMQVDAHHYRDSCKLIGFVRENNFTVNGKEKNFLKPDGAIFLTVKEQNYLLLLEADLSTEVVESRKISGNSIRRKIELYTEFKKYVHRHEIINSVGGINSYRVLFVCKSEQRLRNFVSLAYSMGKTRMFWFTTKEWLEQGNCLFDKLWALPDGEFYSLF